ncbi:MAG: DUF4394 domain-containing protein [Pseudomonadota bacterium]|nr:DUF4394 domain-containing protein [Pseudomonadota bacterium]
MKPRALVLALSTTACLGFVGCDSDSSDSVFNPAPPVATGDTIVLTEQRQLMSFNRTSPSTLVSNRSITGLRSGDQLVGIDYRPANGMLYGVGALGNIYTLDPSTGTATFVSALVADTTDTTAPYSSITGDPKLMSVDFNPAADRLRVVGNDGQNLRINVDTGATITDGDINGGSSPAITSVAYTNSFAGTGNTRMFDIDVSRNRLYQQNANAGTLLEFAPLGINAKGSSGFDIDGINNMGYAILSVADSGLSLYTIDLSTIGSSTPAATRVDALPNNVTGIRGMALKPAADAGAMIQGLSANNQLVAFSLADPSKTTTTAITGLATGERMVGIDYRLRTDEVGKSGLLYGLSNMGNLYTIDPATGAASNKTALVADDTGAFTGLVGAQFAVDFNPVPDRLRVISNTGQNLRINVDNGVTIVDGTLNGVDGASVGAAAYINSYQGMIKGTALYDLNISSNQLLQQINPNAGTLAVIGDLGVDLSLDDDLDITGGDNGLILASITADNGVSTLYRVDLSTGAATPAIRVEATPNMAASRIGAAGTPALIDLAILLK